MTQSGVMWDGFHVMGRVVEKKFSTCLCQPLLPFAFLGVCASVLP